MEKTVLNVEGMGCSHCENAVSKAVSALAGVENVSVNLKEKTVAVEYDGSKVQTDRIKNAIIDQGYEVL